MISEWISERGNIHPQDWEKVHQIMMTDVDPNFDVDKEQIDSDDSRSSNSQNESSSDSESNIPLNVWRKIKEAMEYRKTLKETEKLHQQDIVDVLAPKWVDRLWNDYECSNCDGTSVTAIDHFRVNSKFGHICERYGPLKYAWPRFDLSRSL